MGTSIDVKAFYDIFREISTLVHSSTDAEEVTELVVWKITEMLEAKGAIIRVINLETNQLDLFASCGLSESYLSKGPISSNKFIAETVRKHRVIIIEDILSDPRIQYPRKVLEEGIKMMIDLPLTLGESVVGVIRIYFAEKRVFSEEELDFIIAISQQCSCAIDKARLIEDQRAQYYKLASQMEKLSALGRMAAGIAHEINNPLAGILLYSSNLIKKAPEEGPFKEGLDIIMHESLRCRNIIRDLLEFARDKEPEKAPTNVNEIIEKALNILENEFRLKRISIVKELSDEMPVILLDVNQMEQVFINLLLNSMEAIQEHGKITVKSHTDLENNCVKIKIADTGAGIHKDDIEKIFEPFFSTKPKGTGLGLSVSYGIIQNHQGDIKVSSKPAQGTCFTIELPFQEEASSSEREDRKDGTE